MVNEATFLFLAYELNLIYIHKLKELINWRWSKTFNLIRDLNICFGRYDWYDAVGFAKQNAKILWLIVY